ncbi:unannotated protein [freshwater metagenome]|uniref:Unannotated protein n=1 Tax=freshwater metagenome TaxID=449393 RepID=A0A6J7TCR4_9ZZZZ
MPRFVCVKLGEARLRHLFHLAISHLLEPLLHLVAMEYGEALTYPATSRSRCIRAPTRTSHIHRQYSFPYQQQGDSCNLQCRASECHRENIDHEFFCQLSDLAYRSSQQRQYLFLRWLRRHEDLLWIVSSYPRVFQFQGIKKTPPQMRRGFPALIRLSYRPSYRWYELVL